MTLYELIKQISEILTPGTNSFYNYVLYTSDDNGSFLRTRYCWWETPVKDRYLGEKEYKNVIVTMQIPFDANKLIAPKERGPSIKMQLDYSEPDVTSGYELMRWHSELGFCYQYIFDLENKTFKMEYKK